MNEIPLYWLTLSSLHLRAPAIAEKYVCTPPIHVAIGGLVGLALKVHLTQARGALSMGPHVYARHA